MERERRKNPQGPHRQGNVRRADFRCAEAQQGGRQEAQAEAPDRHSRHEDQEVPRVQETVSGSKVHLHVSILQDAGIMERERVDMTGVSMI